MSKYNERMKAREMRKNGLSIILISRKLSVSKSSVSDWCNDITLTKKQVDALEKSKGISHTTGQRLGAERNKQKKIEAITTAENWAKETINKISKKELLYISMALYWCEGSKTESTSGFMFVNSDPQMILVMKKFLVEVMEVPKEDIVCCVQINRSHESRIQKVLIFWKKLLELRNSQMRKPYFVNTKTAKVYENHDNYFGVCRLFVRKSRYLKYKILGLIKAFKNEMLSA